MSASHGRRMVCSGWRWCRKRPMPILRPCGLAFEGLKLVHLQLDDRLGQQTQLEFSRIEINPRLDDGSFRFDIPPGADVIDDSAL